MFVERMKKVKLKSPLISLVAGRSTNLLCLPISVLIRDDETPCICLSRRL